MTSIDANLAPQRELQLKTFSFLVIISLIALIGTPIYVYFNGITTYDIVTFVFYFFITGLSITMGYHRLYAHSAYKANPIIEFFYLFFGAAAFEQSALKWASQHRTHHLYTDTDRDPYNIQRGFWYAHIGWLLFWKKSTNYDNVQDLYKSKLIMHQHNWYPLWAFFAGIILPVLIGAALGHGWSTFFIAVCFRIFFVHQATFSINSFCHWVGKATYDPTSSAKDHWLVAIFTFGEGYHNFHHRFPSDYRNGIKWYHWDPSKWSIKLLSFFNLTTDLKKIPQYRILQARVYSENIQVQKRLEKKMQNHPKFSSFKAMIESKYALLQTALSDLERAVLDYKNLTANSTEVRDMEKINLTALNQQKEKQKRFKEAYQEWIVFTKNIYSSIQAACA